MLIADLPPGTGEVQQGLVTLSGDVSAVLVVTPAEVSHLDTSRAIAVLRQADVPLLGGVENMAYVLCPHCGERTGLHTPAPEDRTIWALGVPKLAGVPFRTDAVVTPGDVRRCRRRGRGPGRPRTTIRNVIDTANGADLIRLAEWPPVVAATAAPTRHPVETPA